MRSIPRNIRFWQVPSDAATAAEMRSRAEDFAAGQAGLAFDGSDIARLDELCDRFLIPGPRKEVRQSVSVGLGAYVGELLVRNGGGTWVYDAANRSVAVRMPSGLLTYPLNKVTKRFQVGHHHSLLEYYRHAMNNSAVPNQLSSTA